MSASATAFGRTPRRPSELSRGSGGRNASRDDAGAEVDGASRREDAAFRRSYPAEQYHAESFANAYLDSLGRGKVHA